MSVATEIQRLIDAKAAMRAAIIAQGVTVDEALTLDGYAARIALIEGGDPLTVPAAFTIGQWAVAGTGTTGAISINVTALPADGGDTITALEYRIDGGTPVALTGTGTGARMITGLTDDVEVDVEIRAVNTVGAGPWSDLKTATPTVSVGGGPAVYEDTEITEASLVAGVGLEVAVPAGGTSADTLILIIDGIYAAQQARLLPPEEWTFFDDYYNLDGFGAGGAIGSVVYTAPGDTPTGTWDATAGSNIDGGWAVHRYTGLNPAAPIRSMTTEDSFNWGVDNNMPSPSAVALEGDGAIAHLYHPQSGDAVGAAASGWTRVVDEPTPGRRSTLVRSNLVAGATGEITHNAGGTYQARISLTLILAAA